MQEREFQKLVNRVTGVDYIEHPELYSPEEEKELIQRANEWLKEDESLPETPDFIPTSIREDDRSVVYISHLEHNRKREQLKKHYAKIIITYLTKKKGGNQYGRNNRIGKN